MWHHGFFISWFIRCSALKSSVSYSKFSFFSTVLSDNCTFDIPKIATIGTQYVFIFLTACLIAHYTEIYLQPFIVRAKQYLQGELVFHRATLGSAAKNSKGYKSSSWLHPTALSLTVYGTVQKIFRKYNLADSIEILPGYIKNDPGPEELLAVASMLIDQSVPQQINGQKVRLYPFTYVENTYQIQPPWISGLTQSLVSQVMLASYLLTEHADYLEFTEQSSAPLFYDIRDGGVRVSLHSDVSNGPLYWYEEYASKISAPPFVLNGHLIALDFLRIMSQYSSKNIYNTHFHAGLQAVALNIHKYNTLFYSFYDQLGNIANHKYHSFHIRQLARYSQYDVSGSLKRARSRMIMSRNLPFGVFERLIRKPSKMLLIIVFFLFFFLALVYNLLAYSQPALFNILSSSC